MSHSLTIMKLMMIVAKKNAGKITSEEADKLARLEFENLSYDSRQILIREMVEQIDMVTEFLKAKNDSN